MSYSWDIENTTNSIDDGGNLSVPISTDQTAPNQIDENHKVEKAGFDSASNEIYELAGYNVEIPTYWRSENKIDGGIQRYSETGEKIAMLQITESEESNDSYPVTFDGLMDDTENIIQVIEETAFNEVTSSEVVDTGVIKGILYRGTIVDQSSGLTGHGEWFTFPSEVHRKWCTLVLCQTENTDYSYIDDFTKIIRSIKPIEESCDDVEDCSEVMTEAAIESTENLTVENCPELAALIILRDPGDPTVSEFASKYYGQVIEFDGCVNAMQNHGEYETRWDVLSIVHLYWTGSFAWCRRF